MKASGIRLGTPAATTRGMREAEMEHVAGWIDQVLRSTKPTIWADIAKKVNALCAEFPVPSLQL
jgi:glycine hydroxymethyltransferase